MNFHFECGETTTTTIVDSVYVHDMFEVMEFSKEKGTQADSVFAYSAILPDPPVLLYSIDLP